MLCFQDCGITGVGGSYSDASPAVSSQWVSTSRKGECFGPSLEQGGILRENKVWCSPLMRILCSPPTAPSVHRRQGGLQTLKAGAGTAEMCCCHLSSWATESLGRVFKCPWYTKVHMPELGCPGIPLCLAPGNLGCLFQLLTPCYPVLITIVSVQDCPGGECC